ncbi:hypothetical protein RU97_GL001279 [Enterococcus canis]|uniref:ABC transporter domain-containing protein n=1 Tax=Enterococcus canis TaxID=214095 RepID=A0A1L8RIX6_9ENTE|nr:ABC transporter ATP-binding protein [Enterococcus canis]OJG19708.1 hypothetical protein RU97_GL001279 [Enterococcus canis]
MNIQHLAKNINHKAVLADINVELPAGEIIGLVGRNGSGKTTFFRTVAGQYLPDQGELLIEGKSMLIDPALKEQLFFLDESTHFLNSYSLKKIALFYRAAYAQFDYDLFLQLVRKYQLPLNRLFRFFSKGMQGLAKIILAVCSNAQYLLLDEPFDGLDYFIRQEVIELLLNFQESGKTLVIASHNLNELETLVDRVLFLKNHTIQKNYHLEVLRSNARKIQIVLREKKVPAFIKENSRFIQKQGRVWVVLFEHYNPALEEQLQALNPLLLEELPLSLADLFEANLRERQEVQ